MSCVIRYTSEGCDPRRALRRVLAAWIGAAFVRGVAISLRRCGDHPSIALRRARRGIGLHNCHLIEVAMQVALPVKVLTRAKQVARTTAAATVIKRPICRNACGHHSFTLARAILVVSPVGRCSFAVLAQRRFRSSVGADRVAAIAGEIARTLAAEAGRQRNVQECRAEVVSRRRCRLDEGLAQARRHQRHEARGIRGSGDCVYGLK